jgi:small subunit ribosomal protein S20
MRWQVPNIKSAKKRVLQSEKRRVRNRFVKVTTRSHIKVVRTAIEAGDVEAAKSALPRAVRDLARSVTKGVLHRNTARRKIGRLTRAVNALVAG